MAAPRKAQIDNKNKNKNKKKENKKTERKKKREYFLNGSIASIPYKAC